MNIFVENSDDTIFQEDKTTNLLWYDSFYKKMVNYTGNYLEYSFIEEEYIDKNGKKIPYIDASLSDKKIYPKMVFKRFVAKPVVSKKKTTIKRTGTAKGIIEEYERTSNIEIDVINSNSRGCLIDIEADKKDIDDFIYFANKKGLRCEQV